MEGFCRACLVKFNDSSLLQYSEKNRRLFVYSTGIQVKRNDTITFQICKDCYSCMKIACTFKKTSRSSDKKLKSYVAIKEDGDSMDFCSYLKQNDDTLKLRLPLMIGSSTPANTRKDDDNESTCTSLQNFMTDILPPEEIPDNEAKIILEVIEEEADILEDSLDSHWLQEEASIDNDSMQFNLSFSPFATPRLANSDHCYTPRRDTDNVQKNTNKYTNFKSVEKFLDNHYGIKDTSLQKLLDSSLSPLKDLNSLEKSKEIDFGGKTLNEVGTFGNKTLEDIDAFDKQARQEITDKDSIDKNLENALRKDTESYPLDLILTPTVRGDISAPATPFISDILFGTRAENYDADEKDKLSNDIIDEFLNSSTKEKIEENIKDYNIVSYNAKSIIELDESKLETIKELQVNIPVEEEKIVIDAVRSGKKCINIAKEIENNKENKKDDTQNFNITNFYCNMCNKKFEHLKGLKIHSKKYHGTQIFTARKKYVRKKMICDYCGKIFVDPRYIIKHLQTHNEPFSDKCAHCPRYGFKSKQALEKHMLIHSDNKIFGVSDKKYVCATCGKSFASCSNYRQHERRHAGQHSHHCDVCGAGFVRASDLACHMRRHTGEKPYHCTICSRQFSRSDSLNRHTRRHTGERPFNCEFCEKTFVTSSDCKTHVKTCLKKKDQVIEEETRVELENCTDYIVNELLA